MRATNATMSIGVVMLLLAVGLVDVTIAAPPVQSLTDVLKDNASRILQVLPKGWSLQLGESEIRVVRNEPVGWYNPSRVPHHLDTHSDLKTRGFVQQSEYVISLGYISPIPRAEVDRMKAENAKNHRNLTTLNNTIDALQEKHSPFTEGWREYAPKNDKEQELVAEYDKLKASLHRIPDFTTADASIFLSQSIGALTVFYSSDVEKECKQVRQTVEAVLVRQVDASRADPEVLMAKFVDAIDARDEKAMLACFGVDSKGQPEHSAIWVLRMLAALRLRDAMQVRFGREATENVLTESWLQAPDTKRLRAARWIVEDGETARIQGGDDWCYRNGIIVGWDFWDRRGWHMGIGVPASVNTEQRGNARSRQLMEIAEKLSEEVKAGKYKTAEEVGETLRSMQLSVRANDKAVERLQQ